MIANALYQGQSVLFVAEKMAALEVVQKRLESIGIGPFCLELHSNKARKKAVLEQLRKVTEVTKTQTPESYALKAKQLAALREAKRLGAKTLFATHYHELSTIENELSNVKNYNIAVKKRGDQMIFLRKIVPGATDDSYGIEVAKLAGLPAPVISRAREILQELESEAGVVRVIPQAAEPTDQVSMMDLSAQQVVAALEGISVETLTPIEAMNELYKLKKMLN
mgnify:CR=1 FL=1